MSADLLREAASRMRELAEGATPGPWQAFHHNERPDESVVTHDDDLSLALCTEEHEPQFTNADADHIAAWHPAVALAVAELLDDIAAWEDEGLGTTPGIERTNYPDAWTDISIFAGNLARAFLGSES